MWRFSAMFRLIFCGVTWNEVAVEVLKREKKRKFYKRLYKTRSFCWRECLLENKGCF